MTCPVGVMEGGGGTPSEIPERNSAFWFVLSFTSRSQSPTKYSFMHLLPSPKRRFDGCSKKKKGITCSDLTFLNNFFFHWYVVCIELLFFLRHLSNWSQSCTSCFAYGDSFKYKLTQ